MSLISQMCTFFFSLIDNDSKIRTPLGFGLLVKQNKFKRRRHLTLRETMTDIFQHHMDQDNKRLIIQKWKQLLVKAVVWMCSKYERIPHSLPPVILFCSSGCRENKLKAPSTHIHSLIHLHTLFPLLESELTVMNETPQTLETEPYLHKSYQKRFHE